MLIKAAWKEGLKFESSHKSGQSYVMDAKPPYGKGEAALPKELVLMGLAGCTGMDVVDILKRSRTPFDRFTVEVEADETQTHPIIFKNIHIKYIFAGKNPPREKVQKAVALSQEKYCGVSAMLKRSSNITYEIVMIGPS
jgi:putative redox protein